MEVTYHHFSTIDSTNNCSKRNAHLFEHSKLTLVTADEQTAGRGRAKRRWISPKNQNIYATYSFFADKQNYSSMMHVSQVLAVSACTILRELGFFPRIKWPNDILIDGKKLGGILCETTTVNDKLCIICGIGINVNMPYETLNEIDIPAISLMLEKGAPLDIQFVLSKLTSQFAKDLDLFLSNGFGCFISKYKELTSHMLNTQIRFHDHQKIWEGILESINDDASITLKLPSGELLRCISGEILFKEMILEPLFPSPYSILSHLTY